MWMSATPAILLAKGFQQVGKDFPVFLHPKTKEELEKLSITLNEKIKTNNIKSYEIESFIKTNSQKYADLEKEIYQDIEGRLYVDNSSSIFKNKNVSDVLDALELFSREEKPKQEEQTA